MTLDRNTVNWVPNNRFLSPVAPADNGQLWWQERKGSYIGQYVEEEEERVRERDRQTDKQNRGRRD